MASLKNRKILLGVSGGISAYKAVELLRLLTGEGASVQVVMTDNAKKFVTPLTFEALSGQPVYHEVFGSEQSASMEHIRAVSGADLLLVAPATANILARLAHGLADDPLSMVYLAFGAVSGTKSVVIAPAMNDRMYAHPAVQENLRILRERGAQIVEPGVGELACGAVGQGRLAEPEIILQKVRDVLRNGGDMEGRRILVTAGPTREPLDPVRYISNPSSGKMGYALAERAARRGASVTLISGPTQLRPPEGVRLIPCERAEEMRDLVMREFPSCDALVMSAAVGDYAPVAEAGEKIKKGGSPWLLELRPTPDILLAVAEIKEGRVVIGFAAETENLLENALAKLRRKKLDLIVANDVSAAGSGFQSDDNRAVLIGAGGQAEYLQLMPKQKLADIILDRLLSLLHSRQQ